MGMEDMYASPDALYTLLLIYVHPSRARFAQDPSMYTTTDLKPDTSGGRFGHIDGTHIGQTWPSRYLLFIYFLLSLMILCQLQTCSL